MLGLGHTLAERQMLWKSDERTCYNSYFGTSMSVKVFNQIQKNGMFDIPLARKAFQTAFLSTESNTDL